MKTVAAGVVYRFEGFVLDLAKGALLRMTGEEIALRRKSFELLCLLVANAGRLLNRHMINNAVWSDVTVSDDSITQCIGDIRRALGDDSQRILRTVPRRGYLFTANVETAPSTPSGHYKPDVSIAQSPPLSLVVLPFTNVGGDEKDDYIADAITEDLTTDLSYLPGALVIARHSAAVYRGKPTDVRRIGDELGVRYLIDGSVRKLGESLRVTVQLIATETNALIWAGRFDQKAKDLGVGQEEIISRLSAALGVQVADAESTRIARDRPNNIEAADLLLQGWSTFRKAVSEEQLEQAAAQYEEALRLDPRSVRAICYLAPLLLNRFVIPDYPSRGDENLLERAAALVRDAMAMEPGSDRVMYAEAALSRAQGRWHEANAIFERLIAQYPNTFGAHRLFGFTKLAVGRAEEAIDLLQRSIRIDPFSSFNRHSCSRIGLALLHLQRDQESIEWQQRALTFGAMGPPVWRAQCHLFMASALALDGHLNEARRALAEAEGLWPFATVRSLPLTMTPRGIPDPAYLTGMRRVQEGLRLAGLRDHVDEHSDFGVTSGSGLHVDLIGRTPMAVAGAVTLVTDELVDLIARRSPIVIDVALDTWGRSIPTSIGWQGSGHWAEFSTQVANRFRRSIDGLMRGDKSAPIVVFCVNAERFSGYNLVSRLVALGYDRVYWYRGGFEAWQANGLPEADLPLLPW